MRSRLLLILSLLLLAALPAGAAPQNPIPVSGLVQGPDGAPLEGARVLLLPVASPFEQTRLELAGKVDPEPAATISTGANGQFRIEVPGMAMWKIAVHAKGMVPREHFLTPLIEEEELAAVRLERDLGLEVRVTGADGKPLSGARVRVSDASGLWRMRSSGWFVPNRIGVADARGVVVVPRAAKERLLVQAGAPGLPFVEAKDVRAGSVALKLPGGASREIRVVDETGKKPVAGAFVRLGENLWCSGPTADDGRLAVPVAMGRQEKLLVAAEDGRWAEGYVAQAKPGETGPKTVKLSRLTPVSGRVISALDGRPIVGALVWDSSGFASVQRSSADGGWRLNVTGMGSMSMVGAAAPGYLRADSQISNLQSGRGPTFALDPAMAAAGVVVDERGQPVQGVEVRATPQFGPRIRGPLMSSGGTARTGATGRFRITGLSSELSHELSLTRTGYAPGRAEVPPMEPGRPAADLRIVLHRGRLGFGRILDPAEQPVAGASVVLLPSAAGDVRMRMMRRFSGEEPKFEATADAAGRFELRDLPAGTYELTARGSGYAPITVPGLAIPEGAGATDLGTVILAAGTALEGWVVDPKGQPIAGAEIVAGESSSDPMQVFLRNEDPVPAAFSGEDGFFRVPDRRAGEQVDLQASKPGYAVTAADRVQVPADPPVRLVMQPSASVEGRTVDPGGKPVPGAWVNAVPSMMARGMRLYTSNTMRHGRSDEDGRFRFEDVMPGAIELRATVEGRQDAMIENLEVQPGQELKGVELVLAPGAAIEGRVLSPSGQPVPGAQVGLVADSTRMLSISARFEMTDGDGRYRLEGVPPGTQNVQAEHKSYRRAVREIEVRMGDNILDLRMEGGLEVAGRVVDDAGIPVPNARVFLREGWRSWGTPSTASGADGSFTLTGVADGTYKLVAEKAGFASSEGEEISVAGSSVGGLEIKLSAGAAIVGQLTGLDFTELSQVRVTLQRSFGRQGQVSPDGTYRIDNVAPGEHLVVASLADDSRRADGKVTVEPGVAEVRLDLDFGAGLTLTGLVLRNGRPHSGQRIGIDGAGSAGRWGSTDHEGRFRFEGLDPGRYVLRVYGSRVDSNYREELEITADRDVLIELQTVAVSGRVVDSADQSPIHNANVTLLPAEGEDTFPLQTSTDARGAFRLGDVAGGRWKLRAVLPGYAPAETDLQVEDAPVDGIELAMQATEGVVLEVLLASGRPPETVSTAVLDSTGRVVSAASYPTGEEGRVRISSVAPGTWELLLDAAGSAPISMVVTAPGNAGRVVLPRPGGLNVKVPALTEARIGAKAALVDDSGKPFRAPWGYEAPREFPLSSGSRRFERLPPGKWNVTVTADDGRTWTGQATVTPGGMAEVTLE